MTMFIFFRPGFLLLPGEDILDDQDDDQDIEEQGGGAFEKSGGDIAKVPEGQVIGERKS
ncbi:MAG: hypothetical protein MZV63_46905 [Marinilabiliales bacterium]|nr:hypothetical protein [Marinilabiliales bacterium]